jgi:hypothetical protein
MVTNKRHQGVLHDTGKMKKFRAASWGVILSVALRSHLLFAGSGGLDVLSPGGEWKQKVEVSTTHAVRLRVADWRLGRSFRQARSETLNLSLEIGTNSGAPHTRQRPLDGTTTALFIAIISVFHATVAGLQSRVEHHAFILYPEGVLHVQMLVVAAHRCTS